MINSITRGQCNGSRKSVEDLVARGYLETVPENNIMNEGVYTLLYYRVTEKGLNVFEPWYKRFWFIIKGDTRSILVSVITAIITTFLALLISRLVL